VLPLAFELPSLAGKVMDWRFAAAGVRANVDALAEGACDLFNAEGRVVLARPEVLSGLRAVVVIGSIGPMAAALAGV
jgi:hypothetical protein